MNKDDSESSIKVKLTIVSYTWYQKIGKCDRQFIIISIKIFKTEG